MNCSRNQLLLCLQTDAIRINVVKTYAKHTAVRTSIKQAKQPNKREREREREMSYKHQK